MKKITLAFAAISALILAGCVKEIAQESTVKVDGAYITATATISGSINPTKVVYDDQYSDENDCVDITAAWEAGDSFTALEINGQTVTEVKFTTKGSGKTAEFTSSGAVTADEHTTWVAVLGDVKVQDGIFSCLYDGQDGSLENIGKYAYAVAKAEGAKPVFDFAKGKKLTYLMRIKLPAGIKYLEFNTGLSYNGGWGVTSDGTATSTTTTTKKGAEKLLTLKSESTAEQVAYLAIPAMRYDPGEDPDKIRDAGLIITIMTSDKKKSQGKVIAQNLVAEGGNLGTYIMSDLSLYDRPLASDAIVLGSVTSGGKTYPLGSWAPFNLGDNFPKSDSDFRGKMFAWGETEPKASFTKDNYKYYKGGTYTTQIGYKYTNTVALTGDYLEFERCGSSSSPSSPETGSFYDIGGTRYDAARVKWGSEWRMPGNEISGNIVLYGSTRLSEETAAQVGVTATPYAKGAYTNKYGYTCSTMGAFVVTANGAELAFYLTPFTQDSSKNTSGTQGNYYTSTSDYGVNNNTYWNRSCQFQFKETGYALRGGLPYQWNGLAIRPVLNE